MLVCSDSYFISQAVCGLGGVVAGWGFWDVRKKELQIFGSSIGLSFKRLFCWFKCCFFLRILQFKDAMMSL
jgi:hypothetical protein